MVFSQHCFTFRTTLLFSRKYSFQCYFYVSNLIQTFQNDWVESWTQSILVIQNSCSIDYPISCQFVSWSSYDSTQSTPRQLTIVRYVIQLDNFTLFVSQANHELTQLYPRKFSDELEVIKPHSSCWNNNRWYPPRQNSPMRYLFCLQIPHNLLRKYFLSFN